MSAGKITSSIILNHQVNTKGFYSRTEQGHLIQKDVNSGKT